MQTVHTKTKVLITVMTYPHPSQSYQELICTAGITEDGKWVRLYPIDYRYRPHHQKFRKYQWIEVELAEQGAKNDQRKESRKPSLDSIRLLGEPLGTKNNWEDRRNIINKLPIHTLNELKALYNKDKTSLGIVRPAHILDLTIEKLDPDWKPAQQNTLNQLRLFGPQPKHLAKIPFKFSYLFECEDSSKPHKAMITDWELGVLYLNEVRRLESQQKAAESVKNKFLNELCHSSKNTQFFMGTVLPYNTWIVIGVFWPPKTSPKAPPQNLQIELDLLQ
ncbi:MAG: hypothetical protein OXD49_14660 [Candidatus Poribacteria bacterium]|nr:hypothetical protein [Candidatus Poribacteria bacterium]